MSKVKLENAFAQVKSVGEKAFVAYIMAGDGGLETLRDKMKFLEEAGVTAIELGIPFSDPVADGPTIQLAGKRALEHGVSLKDVIIFLRDIKDEISIPIVLMTYFNPVYQYGLKEFSFDAKKAGVSGVIIPDLPLEQSEILHPYLQEQNIALIQLVTLTSPENRKQKIASASEGFLYAVTVNGITGARKEVSGEIGAYLSTLGKMSSVPVLAGFGISTPEQVKEVGSYCDGVIVGSKIISLFEEGKHDEMIALIQASKGASRV